MAKVSVIIPTFNRAQLLPAAIKSVLEQTYADWELIVVDDGSQDNTEAVVRSYHDPRIRYFYQENAGTPSARNRGIRQATGEYIAFLDSDDWFLPNKLERQVAMLASQPQLGLVASGWAEVDPQGVTRRAVCPWQLHPTLAKQDFLYSCHFVVPGVLVRSQWLHQVGFFDEQLRYVEDWDLWLRLAFAGSQAAWLPEILCCCTIHPQSKIHHVAAMSSGLLHMWGKFFSQSQLPPEIRAQQSQVLARAYLDCAVRVLGAGGVAEGSRYLCEAIRQDPSLVQGQPPAVLNSLASAALTPVVANVEAYIADVCQSLRQLSPPLVRSPRQLRAMIHATKAFEQFAYEQRSSARRTGLQTIWQDPGWLRNRGLLKICFCW